MRGRSCRFRGFSRRQDCRLSCARILHRGIREHSVTSEALVWLCKERTGEWRELITPDLLGRDLVGARARST